MADKSSVKKDYIIDTNVLLEDSSCIQKLMDKGQNNVFIPFEVLMELDGIKNDNKRGMNARHAINNILENLDSITILGDADETDLNTDLKILGQITKNKEKFDNPIFVSNDNLLTIISKLKDVKTEIYRESQPLYAKAESITGVVNKKEDAYNNCYFETKKKVLFCDPHKGFQEFNHKYNVLNIKPKDMYQNMAMDLMFKDHIDVVSIASKAGTGKTFLALAVALDYVFNRPNSKYSKIYITKPTIETGDSVGFLPGDLEEKVLPFMKYIHSLLIKICDSSQNKRVKEIFKAKNMFKLDFNEQYFELLPITTIRGMDIENAILIIDETQNISRDVARAVLSRLGENTKAFCLGDVNQIDHPKLNKYNNGINWIVDKFHGEPNYAHIVLAGQYTRGPICDLVNRTGL